jgi:hypothetical protein
MAPYKKYIWKEENKPEGWEEVSKTYATAIDEAVFNAYYNPTPPVLVTAPREQIFCEYETTKWRYVEPRMQYGYEAYRARFKEPQPYMARTMMAVVLTVKGEVRYRASNGVQIVSSTSGTHWIDTERRLHICRVEQGLMACGNTGIIVNEGSFNEIIEAVNEYNRPQETPVRAQLPDFVTYYEYNAMTREQREVIKRLYHQDELTARWIRDGYTVPFAEKEIKIDDKILSDDMFKVE